MPIIQIPSIASVVEDQSPQLGGDLDCQDYRLEWGGSSQYIGSTILGAGLTVSAGSNLLTLASNGNLDINTGAGVSARFLSGGGLSVGGTVAPLSVDSFYDLGSTSLRWANTYTDTITIGNGVDAILTADAADTLALRNSTTAQQFNVYNTYTDASNYERLEVKWEDNGFGADRSVIETTAGGTGVGRTLALRAADNIIDIRSDVDYMLRIRKNFAIYCNEDVVPAISSGYSNGTDTLRWATTYTDGVATDVETFTATSDTLDANNNVALCDCTSNAITINLPAASTASGLQYHIKKTDSSSNTVTIDGNGTETIDGSLTAIISTQYDSITVVSDGSNWFII